MLDDNTGPQQRHLHMYSIILTSSCRRHNTLSIKGKNFSKYRKVTKTTTNPLKEKRVTL